MTKYLVTICREVWEYYDIEVSANSQELAEQQAMQRYNNAEWHVDKHGISAPKGFYVRDCEVPNVQTVYCKEVA